MTTSPIRTVPNIIYPDSDGQPSLQIKFTINEDSLEIHRPDGQKFLTTIELNQRANQESDRADREHERAECLLAQLKALGIQPD
jgi:hypothetical protein